MKRSLTILGLVSMVCVLAGTTVLSQNVAPAVIPAPAVPVAIGQPVATALPVQATRPTVAPTPRPVEAQPQERLSQASPSLDDVPNVRVEVTITYQAGQNPPVRRSASLMVAKDENGSLRSGNQVPVPSTTFVPVGAPVRAEGSTPPGPPATAGPMTSFNYRSVGLNVDARRVRVMGNKAKLDLSVEFSAIDEKVAEQGGRGSIYPSFPTFSQNLTLVLESGKPLVITQTSDVVDNVERKQSVEVKATILR